MSKLVELKKITTEFVTELCEVMEEHYKNNDDIDKIDRNIILRDWEGTVFTTRVVEFTEKGKRKVGLVSHDSGLIHYLENIDMYTLSRLERPEDGKEYAREANRFFCILREVIIKLNDMGYIPEEIYIKHDFDEVYELWVSYAKGGTLRRKQLLGRE